MCATCSIPGCPVDQPIPMKVTDFPRRYRFRMVHSYPTISGVADVYEATHDEIDAGFARCLENRHLRRTHELYLDKTGNP